MKETARSSSTTSLPGRTGAISWFSEELNAARQELRRLGLLGVNESGIGYGNVSLRDGTTDFVLYTGSRRASTTLGWQDYAKVVAWISNFNWLRCEGRAIASAESLTHAAVYSMPANAAIVHGHEPRLWQSLCERGVATSPVVPYGTARMAREVQATLWRN